MFANCSKKDFLMVLQHCTESATLFTQILEELLNQKEYRPRYVHDVLLVIHRVLHTDDSLKVSRKKCSCVRIYKGDMSKEVLS